MVTPASSGDNGGLRPRGRVVEVRDGGDPTMAALPRVAVWRQKIHRCEGAAAVTRVDPMTAALTTHGGGGSGGGDGRQRRIWWWGYAAAVDLAVVRSDGGGSIQWWGGMGVADTTTAMGAGGPGRP